MIYNDRKKGDDVTSATQTLEFRPRTCVKSSEARSSKAHAGIPRQILQSRTNEEAVAKHNNRDN